MFGTTLHYEVHWIAPCIAMGVWAFAIQTVTTVACVTPHPEAVSNLLIEPESLILWIATRTKLEK
jgi:hypothetical protein